jgi:hypothetical protein
MTLVALGEDRRVSQSNELASLPKHPDTFFPHLFGDFTGVIHICKDYSGVFPKVVGGACIVGHLGDGSVSQDTISSHFLDEDVGASNVLLMVCCADVSKLGVAG